MQVSSSLRGANSLCSNVLGPLKNMSEQMAAAMSQQLTTCVDELIMVNGVDRKHDVATRKMRV